MLRDRQHAVGMVVGSNLALADGFSLGIFIEYFFYVLLSSCMTMYARDTVCCICGRYNVLNILPLKKTFSREVSISFTFTSFSSNLGEFTFHSL